MYHLFYADQLGNPGTDLTFFEIPNAGHTYSGSQSISTTSLRVKDDKALNYWQQRLEEHNVDQDPIQERFGRQTLMFRDPEEQRIQLISDQSNTGVEAGTPWSQSPVPVKHGITGLGPVFLTVQDLKATEKVLIDILGFRKAGNYNQFEVYESGLGGTGSEVHVEERSDLSKERPGRGSVHHVAFRVENEEELQQWHKKIQQAGFPNSGLVDRYYFKSLYFRESNHILFELATDGPGFATDEDEENLGEKLALPPFLEDKRDEIEASLVPLETNK